jgi:hypothetical protein
MCHFHHLEERARNGLVFRDGFLFLGDGRMNVFIGVRVFLEDVPLLLLLGYFFFDLVEIRTHGR